MKLVNLVLTESHFTIVTMYAYFLCSAIRGKGQKAFSRSPNMAPRSAALVTVSTIRTDVPRSFGNVSQTKSTHSLIVLQPCSRSIHRPTVRPSLSFFIHHQVETEIFQHLFLLRVSYHCAIRSLDLLNSFCSLVLCRQTSVRNINANKVYR